VAWRFSSIVKQWMKVPQFSLVFIVCAFLFSAVSGEPVAWGELEQPQEEFVPIDQIPPEDQLPAAPLLIAAYAIVWVVVFAYLWSIWRRLAAVENDLHDLSKRVSGDVKRST